MNSVFAGGGIAPAAPTASFWYNPTPDTISIYWIDNSTNENSFTVERKVDGQPDTSYIAIGSQAPVDVPGTGSAVYFADGATLSYDTTYDYRVKAIALDGTPSAYSNVASGITAPLAPISMTAARVAGTDDSIQVTFKDNAVSSTGFNIYRSSDNVTFSNITGQAFNPGKGNTETFTDTGLDANSKYYYYATATNGAGESVPSNTANATTNSAQTVPAAPNGVYGGSGSAGPVGTDDPKTTVRAYFYDGSTNESGFTLQRQSEDNLAWVTINTSAGAPGTGTFYDFYDTGLAIDTEYSYRVFATNSKGSSDFGPAILAADTVPVTPLALTAAPAPGTDDSINLNFTDNARHTSYFNFYRSTDNVNFSFISSQTLTPGKGSAETYTDTGLNVSTQYYYYVTAVDAAGESPVSATASATTNDALVVPAAPNGLYGGAGSSGADGTANPHTTFRAYFYDASTNETSFTMQRQSEDNPTWVTVNTVPGSPGTGTLYDYYDSGLAIDTQYSYREFATNSIGNSDFAPYILSDYTVPVAPIKLTATATAGADDSITLNFTDNSRHAAYFGIYRSTDGVNFTGITNQTLTPGKGNTETYTDSGLNVGTKYYYYVTASNNAGESGATNTASATTGSAVTVPAAPNGVYGGVGSSGVDGTDDPKTTFRAYFYDASTNENSFSLQRQSEDAPTWVTINTTPGAADTGTFYDYYDTGLAVDTNYSYRVFATNSIGDSDFGPSILTDSTVPVAPINLSATADSDTQITLAFTDHARHSGSFAIYRSTDGTTFTSLGGVLLNPGKGNTETYKDTTVAVNTQYYYYVTAYNDAGESPASNTATAATLPANAPASPTSLNATASAHATEVSLNWLDNSTDEYGFVVERLNNDDPTGVYAAVPGTTPTVGPQAGFGIRVYYNDTTAADDTSYSYRVKAINPAGASSYTNVASVVTVPVAPSNLKAVPATTSVTLTWNNNAKHAGAFLVYRKAPGETSFTALPPVAAVAGVAQTFTDTGLLGSQTYQYYVLAYNTGGQSDPTATVSTTTLASDTTAPTTSILTGPASGSTVCANSATFTVTATDPDNPTSALVYEYKIDAGSYSALSSTTTINLTGLSEGSHTITVASSDPAGNLESNPPSRTFTVDTIAPIISAISTGTPTQTGTSITWTTDKVSTSTVKYRVHGTTTYTVVNGTGSPSTAHTVVLTGLVAGTTYDYQVFSSDACNQASSTVATFATTPDLTPPSTQITSGPADGATVCTQPVVYTVTATDPDNTTASLVYKYKVDAGAYSTPSSSTTISLIGLAAGAHTITIAAIDPAGNVDPNPQTVSFTLDTSAPIISAVTAVPADITAVISWTTNVPSGTQVLYGQTAALGSSTILDAAPVTSHSVTITGLTPLTSYHFVAVSGDSCVSAQSANSMFGTTATPLPTLSVTSLTFPATVTAHQNIDVAWTVLNAGPGAAATSWNDSLYLSPTSTLNISDPNTVLLGTYSANTPLTAGSQYTLTQAVDLPGQTAGTYYLIVAADLAKTLLETSRTGNALAMPITFQKVQTLLLSPDTNDLTLHVGTALPGQLQIGNIGSTALKGLAVTVTGGPSNVTYQTNLPAQVAPMSSGTLNIAVLANNASITSGTATVTVSSSDGQAASATMNLTVITPKPNLVITSNLLNNGVLTSGMVLGQQTIVQCTVTNQGDAAATGLQVSIPGLSWMALSSPATIGDLPPGQSASVVLDLTPPVGLPLAVYKGLIAVNGTNASIPINFAFTAVSTGVGDLKITTKDEFSYFAAGNPPLTGATVSLVNAVTGVPIALNPNITDLTGNLLIKALPSGPYQVKVTSPNHADFNTTALITSGRELDLPAFLSANLVTYKFTVIPITINDTYDVTLQAIFQTNVPAPVVTISPMQVDLSKLAYDANGQSIVYFTVTNHGLIAADDTSLNFPTRTDYSETTPVTNLGKLAALTTIVVPVTITNLALQPAVAHVEARARAAAAGASGGCTFPGFLSYDYNCDGPVGKQASVEFDSGGCPPLPGVPPGGALQAINAFLGGLGSGGSGGVGGSGSIYIPDGGGVATDLVEPTLCDPCRQAQAKAAIECIAGFTPTGCPVAAAVNGAECADSVSSGGLSASNVEGCLLGAGGAAVTCLKLSSGAGAALNAANCVVSWPDCAAIGAPGGAVSSVRASTVHKAAALSTDPFLAQVQLEAQRLKTLMQPDVILFGDPKWFSTQPADSPLEAAYASAFFADAAGTGGLAQAISPTNAAKLAALPLPAQISAADVNLMVARWNNSIADYSQGFFTANQLPAGASANFIDFSVYHTALDAARQAISDDQADGGDGTIFNGLLNAEQNDLQNILDQAQLAGTCAQVKIQLNQTVAITRSAFQATLTLSNSAQSQPLTNVQVNLKVTDSFGNDQTSLFAVSSPALTGFAGPVDGTGMLGVATDGTAQWTIVPTHNAAPNGDTVYYVGGTISYSENGTKLTIPVYGTGITVRPDPLLQLHYFLQGTVYGPDPFDPFNVNTSPEPFSLGLLAVNIGKGVAHNFNITSSQPTIVDNEKGLLVDFQIIGTQVNKQQVEPSLMVNFGDLTAVGTPGSTGSAQFLMTASLAGQFVSFDASFKHTDDLGTNTSLIDSVDIHSLEHVVLDLWPTDDGKPDFLSEQNANADGLPDTLWSSDNTKYPVTSVTNAFGDAPVAGPITIAGPVTDVALTTTLTVATPPTGFVYLRTDDPSNGHDSLVKVLRSDGTALDIGPNVWTTNRNVHLKDGSVQTEHRLYIFDYNSTGSYTLIYGQAAPVDEAIGGLKQVPDGTKVTFGQTSSTGGTGTGAGGVGTAGIPPVSGAVIVTAVFPDCMYVESLDRSSGIKVVPAGAALNSLVMVSGVMSTGANSERFIDQAQTSIVGTGSIAPLGFAVKPLYGGANLNGSGVGQIGVLNGAGLNPVGLYTSTLGKVTTVDATDFFLDDGFGKPVRVVLPTGVSAPTLGSFVGINDVVSMENDQDGLHPMLRLRSAADIQTNVSGLAGTFTAPSATLHKGQNLFSLPGIPVTPAPNTILNPVTGGASTLLIGNLSRYDAPTQSEVFWDAAGVSGPFGNLLLGEGYRLVLGSAPAAQLQFSGYLSSFADMWIPLPLQGVTRIGDPFSFGANWANVLVTDGTKTVTLADAARVEFPAWISSKGLYYDSTAQANKTLGLPDDVPAPDSTQLAPWGGYYVTSMRNNLALIVPLSTSPMLAGLSPSNTPAQGLAFTLTVSGSNFVNGATVDWNGSPRTTTFVSSNQLTAQITATDIATQTTVPVTVVNPNSQISNAITFTVTAAAAPPTPNPVPVLTSLSPQSTPAGGLPFTLTVTGSSFVNGSKVMWNGVQRSTTYLSPTQLTVQIGAPDIAASASVPVTVFSPTPGGGTSAAATFLVTTPSATDVSSSMRFTGTGLSYNPFTKIFLGKLTITNSGTKAIAGPIETVLTGLPAGTTLTNASGSFQGNPYLVVSSGSLAAGASVTVTVSFTRTGTAGISYGLQFFSGAL